MKTNGNAHVSPFTNFTTNGQEMLVETRCRNTFRILSRGLIKSNNDMTKQPIQMA